jgi:hypothetical protein
MGAPDGLTVLLLLVVAVIVLVLVVRYYLYRPKAFFLPSRNLLAGAGKAETGAPKAQ